MGISADQVDRQKEFDEANNLGFPLLSDADRKISAVFGAKRIGKFPGKRMTFVIDTDRTVLAAIKSETNMHAHADEALAALAARD